MNRTDRNRLKRERLKSIALQKKYLSLRVHHSKLVKYQRLTSPLAIDLKKHPFCIEKQTGDLEVSRQRRTETVSREARGSGSHRREGVKMGYLSLWKLDALLSEKRGAGIAAAEGMGREERVSAEVDKLKSRRKGSLGKWKKQLLKERLQRREGGWRDELCLSENERRKGRERRGSALLNDTWLPFNKPQMRLKNRRSKQVDSNEQKEMPYFVECSRRKYFRNSLIHSTTPRLENELREEALRRYGE